MCSPLLIPVLLLVSFSESARILVVVPSPSYSHAVFARSIYEELAIKGHEILAFTAYARQEKMRNLKEIELEKPATVETDIDQALNTPSFVMNAYLQWKFLQTCDVIYSNKEMKKILENETFDLVMIEWNVVPCFSVLAEHFKAPLIGIRSLGLRLEGHDYIANPTNPSYINVAYNNHREGFFGRFNDLVFSIYWRLHHHLITVPNAQNLVEKYFPDYQGNVVESEKKVDLVFTNTHYLINGVRPLVPALVEIGLIHVGRNIKPLAKDVEFFLNDNPNGFIFFNLGTLLTSKYIDHSLFDSFAKLPFNFVIKMDTPPDILPKNVKTGDWFESEAILAHPNIKLLITHGGLLSLQEAIFHQVPVVVIPFLFDQPSNAFRMEELGVGKIVQHRNIGLELCKAIVNVTGDANFERNVEKISRIIKDEFSSPKVRAVWWVEYVLRHRGAPYIKSKAVHMDWFTYLLLDVILFTFVSISVLVILIKKLVRKVKKLKRD